MRLLSRLTDRFGAMLADELLYHRRLRHFFPHENAVLDTRGALMDKNYEAP